LVPSGPNTPGASSKDREPSKQGFLHGLRKRIIKITASREDLSPRLNGELREYDEVPRPTPVSAIPDVHADLKALQQALYFQGMIDTKKDWTKGKGVLELLGDYIDRGPANLLVLDYLVKLRGQVEASNGRMDLLAGNHEALLLGAVANFSDYRKLWFAPENEGHLLFEEVRRRYQLPDNDDEAVWNKLRELVLGEGAYGELFRSMKLMSQVDDVLYVHGGLGIMWARYFKERGADGVSDMWQNAVGALMAGEPDDFEFMMSGQSPLWMRYRQMAQLKEGEIIEIAHCLKARGVNAVVVGHDIMPLPQLQARFDKYGIKLIGADVGMSSCYGGTSTNGGVRIDQQGNIEGRSKRGLTLLYETDRPAPISSVA